MGRACLGMVVRLAGLGGLVAGPLPLPGPFFLEAIAGRQYPPRAPQIAAMLVPGDRAPSFNLPDIDTGDPVSDPWRDTDAPTVLAFFKVTCPVCQMAAPMVQACPRREWAWSASGRTRRRP